MSFPERRELWIGHPGQPEPDERTQSHGTAGILSADVPLVDQGLFAENGMSIPDVARTSMVRWLAPGSGFMPSARSGWLVRSRLGFAHNHPTVVGTDTPGLKMISFVKRRADLSPQEFDERYRQHIEVAKEHHAGIWQYAQSLVEQVLTADAPPIDGISELWFESATDFAERFYSTPESPAAVQEDTKGFIDFSGTFSVLTTDVQFVS